jgi:diguanylate cyclase (GGDEF)-like protein
MGNPRRSWRSRKGRVRSYEFRVRTGLAYLLVPVSLAGIIGLVALFQVGSAHRHLADELGEELETLSTLRHDLHGAGELIEEYASTGSPDTWAEYDAVSRSIESNLALVAEFDEPEEVRLGTVATTAWDAGRRDAAHVFSGARSVELGHATSAGRHLSVAEGHIAALDAVSRADLQETAERSASTSRVVVFLALLFGALATVMNVALVQRLLNATFGPLRHLIEGVGRFSGGDLTQRIEPRGDREFQAVGESFNAMAVRLEDSFAALEHQAFHDSLTDLPNRAGLLRHLQTAHDGSRAIALFDIDDFKRVNDGLGEGAGDEALIQIARRLAGAVRPGDFLSRLGGDEFVVVFEGVPLADAATIAEDLASAISHAVDISGRSVVLHASAGVAPVYPGEAPTDVLRTADVALHVAKGAGKRCVRLFIPEMLQDVEGGLQMATDLRQALAHGQISIDYQPTVSIASGTVHGVEALMRWTHPERGAIPPFAFIPVAEETGQILALGRYVLETACQQAKTWQQLPGLEHLSMNVNVSAVQLQVPEIVADVARALEISGLAPASLVLEVTESVMADPEAVARVHEIKRLGVRIALDDFGTGYSSLSYLQRLPIDVLKIDKSFIDGIDRRTDRAVLASTIVRLGRSLGLVTVAEGVERADQLRTLESFGCDIVQGYLLARPQPPEELESRLLELAGSTTEPAARPSEQWVRVTVGPLDLDAARDWLHHAHWALDEIETGRLLPGQVSTSVVALMRDYLHRWSIAAMGPDAFVWVADEDAELLGTMMSRWSLLSAALVDAARRGTVVISPAAAGFSQALVHSILMALAARQDDEPVQAAVLAQQWPNQTIPARESEAGTAATG